ncbi:MAG TPA: exodeoxyribonuclease V subunit beta [Terriglobia bacterium]|nr:exodeoxyribonuclease V subunit beta [Terriglobia bacterium]
MRAFDPSGSALEGHQLIEASAGTGKTAAVSALYLRLVLERRCQVRDILVITFTKAATEELRTRIRKIVRGAYDALETDSVADEFVAGLLAGISDRDDARLQLINALHSFDEAAIFTIHAFCQRVLQENAFESSGLFDTPLVTDSSPVLREIAADYWRINVYEASPLFQQFVFREYSNPEELFSTVGHAFTNPYLCIIPRPEKADSELMTSLERQLEFEYGRLQQSWKANREAVSDILRHYEGLSRSSYKEDVICTSIEEIEQYLSSAVLFKLPSHFSKFRSETLAQGTKKGHAAPKNAFFLVADDYFRAYQALEELYQERLLNLRVSLFEYVKKELKVRTRRQNVRFFDDLLLDLYDALRRTNGPSLAVALRDKYRAVLVDEFQDTDPVQYFVLKSVFRDPDSPFFLIGDPKQAIYSFRGADVFAYMEAANHIPARSTLEKNWRSSPNLVRAVNALFRRTPYPFVFAEIGYQEVEPANLSAAAEFLWNGKPDAAPLKAWFVERPPDKQEKLLTDNAAYSLLPRAVASEILSLLEAARKRVVTIGGNPLSPADLAVLVRTNYQAALIQQALQEQGIPALLYTSASVFATWEAMEVERVLWGIAEAGFERRVKAALSTDLFGLTGSELAVLEENEVMWDDKLRTFAEYRTLWVNQGLLLMSRVLMLRQKVRSRLLFFPDGERRLTNFLQIFELLHQAALENHLGMEGVLTWLAERRHENRPLAPEEHQLRLETDEKAVKIVTVHKSKGLEFPLVFCPFAWDGPVEKKDSATFHDPTDKTILIKDLGSEGLSANKVLAQREGLSENARLLYVALTRAKYRCYLVWGAFSGGANSALTYLLRPPNPSEAGDAVIVQEGRFNRMISDEELLENFRDLVRESQGSIELLPLPEALSDRYSDPDLQGRSFSCRRFTGEIPADWGTTSFTSLVTASRQELEFPDRDALQLKEWSRPVFISSPRGRSMFEFPRGVRAGNVLHEIFERLDFSKGESEETRELIRERLREHGFDLGWEETVNRMIQNALSIPLGTPEDPIYLNQLAGGNRLQEIEFTFPIERLTPWHLKRILKNHATGEFAVDLVEKIEQLEFSTIRGWLKGFIDLVFQRDGRFYLVDWKSNYLGDRIEAYRTAALKELIRENFYFLQYYLYTVALHRYLRLRIPNYDYDSHFGCVFYVFLRGIDPGSGSEYGVFQDRPDERLIQALDDCFQEGAS